jgi:hypothetical protein
MRVISFALLFVLGCAGSSSPEMEHCEVSEVHFPSIMGAYSTSESNDSTMLSSLVLLPNGEYRWSRSGCFYFVEIVGTFQQEGDILRLQAKKSEPFDDAHAPNTLHLRRWSGKNILLLPSEVAAFDAAPSNSFGYLQEAPNP